MSKKMTTRGEYALVGVTIAALTLVTRLLPADAYQAVGLIYLLVVVLLSLRVGRGPVFAAAILSGLVWDYLFIPPYFKFQVSTLHDGLLLGTYLVVALVGGQYTARVRTQAEEREQLRAAGERERMLAESERLHRALLDSVSHELRTPLAVITAALENLGDRPNGADSELVGEMRTAASRLNRLVANLLDQTRLESGTLRPRLDWCDALDLINAAIEEAGDAFGAHPLEVAVDEDLPSVRADFTLLVHALANLLLNACRHTPAGTPVSVRAGLAEGKGVCFVVSDRGAGLPEGVRDRIFRKFERGEARAGGLGLGLSIVRGFVAAQGGEVVADANPGGGARFAIYLPHSGSQTAPAE
jgi:two-component system sensor histidine kinase KdpD